MKIKKRFYQAALVDKDIDNLENFMNYVDVNYGDLEEDDELGRPSMSDFTGDMSLYGVGDSGDLRTQRIRGGMKSKLVSGSDRLRNSPEEGARDYEVYNEDRIPFRIYDKMDRDPVIAIGKYFLSALVSILKPKVSHPDEKVEEVVAQLYRDHHNSIVRNSVRTALKYGYAFGEKVWQREDVVVMKDRNDEQTQIFSGRVASLKKIKFLDPSNHFEFWKDKDDELSKIVQQQAHRRVTVKRNKIYWFIMDREFSSIFGTSRYKNIYLDWYQATIDHQYMVRQLQRSGSPHLEGRYPRGTDVMPNGQQIPRKNIMMKYAKALTSTGSVNFPNDRDESGNYLWTLEYKEPKNTSIQPHLDFQKFSSQRKLMGLGILSAILLDGGNFSEVDAKVDLMVLMIEDVVDQIEMTIKKDIIEYLTAYNFGPVEAKKVGFKIERSALGLRKILKEIAIQTQRVIASDKNASHRVLPDLGKLYENLGVPYAAIDKVVEEVEDNDQGGDGEDPMKVQERNEKSNDEHRVKDEDDRERGRRSERDDAVQ